VIYQKISRILSERPRNFGLMQKLLQNETTDEHGAGEPQPKKSRRRRVRTLPGNLRVLCGREKKCIAGFQPAKVVLTQKELSRLRCRRDAGATIFSHDLCLCGETLFWLRLPCAVSQVIHGRDARATLAAGAREDPATP